MGDGQLLRRIPHTASPLLRWPLPFTQPLPLSDMISHRCPARRCAHATAFVATILTIALPARSGSQPTRISAAALRDDIQILRRALETLHPGLYRYNTPDDLSRRFSTLEARLANGATLAESYLAIGALTSGLRCGHTFPNPANQSDSVAGPLFHHTPRTPFYFEWLDRRMVVTRDASRDGAFPPGTEVLAINGVTTSAVLERLLPYTRTDGANEAKRLANLGVHPAERWEAFDVLYPLVFPAPSGEWTFRVRSPGSAPRTVRAAPTDVGHRLALYDSLRSAARDTTSPPWTLRFDGDGIATLTMPSWVTYNDAWDWEGFVHRAFQEIDTRRATILVIDLRGNEGGTSVGDVLLSHLVDRDIVPVQLRRYTRYRSIPPDLRPYLATWDRSFDDWGAAATPADAPPGAGTTGFYRLTRYDSDTAGAVIRPAAPRFAGKVFVLVGADNSSATFEFALAVREHRLGTLVGRPTGGNQRGINGGAFYFLRLPNSRVEVDLPLIGYYAPTTRPNAGLAPDVLVRKTPADVARGRDPEMDAVRRLVARGSRPSRPR